MSSSRRPVHLIRNPQQTTSATCKPTTKAGRPANAVLCLRHTLAGLLFTLGAAPAQTLATDCASCWEWSLHFGLSGTPTAAVYADGLIVYALGNSVHLVEASSGHVLASRVLGIGAHPSALVELPDDVSTYKVFVASADGYLTKLDVAATLPISVSNTKAQYRDLRRGSCGTDSLLAEPVVQRRADSNPAFALDKDIVIVATAHGCGDTTQNQVVALDASDVTQPPVWVFNSGEYEVARIRACTLDLTRNRLNCGVEHPDSSSEPGLISLDTNDGSLAWSAVFDTGVHVHPISGSAGGAGEGHVYIGDQLGRLQSFNASDGTSLASRTIVTAADGVPPRIDVDPTVGSAAFSGSVYAVGSSGRITAVYDGGSEFYDEWDTTFADGQRARTAPLPNVALNRLYVATDRGVFHQLNLSSGSDDASAPIGFATPGSQHQSSLSLYSGGDGLERLVTVDVDSVNGDLARQFVIPCRYGSSNCVPDLTIFRDGFE
jgi:hypothetical protein